MHVVQPESECFTYEPDHTSTCDVASQSRPALPVCGGSSHASRIESTIETGIRPSYHTHVTVRTNYNSQPDRMSERRRG